MTCYAAPVVAVAEIERVLGADARIGYALLFGSVARGAVHAGSDVDVALAAGAGA